MSAASACVAVVHVGGVLGFRADDASPPFPPFGAEVDGTLSHAYTGPIFGNRPGHFRALPQARNPGLSFLSPRPTYSTRTHLLAAAVANYVEAEARIVKDLEATDKLLFENRRGLAGGNGENFCKE